MNEPPDKTYPAAFFADLFRITVRHFRRLILDGIIPEGDNGQHYLTVTIKTYVRYLQERASGGDINSTDFGTENIRVKKLTADKLQLEVDLLKKNIIPIEDVNTEISNIILATRSKLLSLPSRLAKIAIAAESLREIEDAAKKIIYECLEELTHDKPQATIETMEATTGSEGLTMGGGIPQPKPRGKRRPRKMAQ